MIRALRVLEGIGGLQGSLEETDSLRFAGFFNEFKAFLSVPNFSGTLLALDAGMQWG